MKNIFRLSGVILFVLSIFLVHSCKKEIVPTLTTSTITNITGTTATSGGTITNEGSGTIIARGVCWSTVNPPTIADNITSDGAGADTFSSSIIGLNAGAFYYIRAYATNDAGTGYGMAMSFITLVADIDGNIYNTVTIGSQVWMVENLKTTKYRNGDLIETTIPALLDISGESKPKYVWAYGGNESKVATYGRLYTWDAVTDSRDVCPTGWHVPSDSEWTTLTTFLGGISVAGGKLKETGTAHWLSPNEGATNESGFKAVAGGLSAYWGGFSYLGYDGYWWSSTENSTTDAWNRIMWSVGSSVYRGYMDKRHGFSVRCLQNY